MKAVILIAILVNKFDTLYLSTNVIHPLPPSLPPLQVVAANGLPFSWVDTLLGGRGNRTQNDDANDVEILDNFENLLRPMLASLFVQSRANWWDPLNLFSGDTTTTTSAPANGATASPAATTTAPPAPFNPFGFITDTFNALGQSVQNVGTGLVNLVTGGGGTTTTTPFPYPDVAAFFSDPGTVAVNKDTKNITLKPEIVKCLSNLIHVYGDLLNRINVFLPNCISGQTWSAVWLAPHLFGLMPLMNMINVPTNTMNDCPYVDGCVLKVGSLYLAIIAPDVINSFESFFQAVQNTVSEVDKAIGGVTSALRNMMPTITNIGKSVIQCMANDFAQVAKELPTSANLSCLKQ